jgi:outer membrane protein TolC
MRIRFLLNSTFNKVFMRKSKIAFSKVTILPLLGIHCMFLVNTCFAQVVDTKAKVSNSGILRSDSIFNVRERLVELAMSGPILEIANRNVEIANQQLGRTKATVLNQLTVSANLNEFSIQGGSTDVANLFPRYNIGLQLPLGLFFTQGRDVKIAYQKIGISEADRSRLFAEVKADVLRLYEDYLMYSSLLVIHTKAASENYIRYIQIESDFEAGDATEDEYIEALRKYKEVQTDKISTQRDKEATRIALEKYILVPLEDVIKGIK